MNRSSSSLPLRGAAGLALVLATAVAFCLPAASGAQQIAASRRRSRTLRTGLRSLLGLGAGLLAVSAAHAGDDSAAPTLMPVQFSLQAQSTYLGQEGIASSGPFFASGSLDAAGPRVAVHGEGLSSVVNAENEASAQALWAFWIAGPAGVDVPILITGLYGAEQNNALSVTGGLALGVDRFRLTYVMSFRCIDGDASGCDSSRGDQPQDFVLHETASSDVLTFMQIATGGSLRKRGTGGFGSFSAFIDPLVSIDPAFSRAGEFTLYVSPGAGGFVAAVPEPQTYALLLAGMAVVVSIARRRRAAVEAASAA